MSRPTITFQVYSPLDYGDRLIHDETVTLVWCFKPDFCTNPELAWNLYTNEPIMYLCTSSDKMITPHPDHYIIWNKLKYPLHCNNDLSIILNDLMLELHLLNL